MEVTEIRHVKGKCSGKPEHLCISFIGDCGVDRLSVNIQLLCYGITVYRSENGNLVELPPPLCLTLLQHAQQSRETLLAKYPIKTFAGWCESGVSDFSDFCRPNETVDQEMVDYFKNSMPPKTMCDGFLQAGEPYRDVLDENGKCRAIYTTFALIGSAWMFIGYCFAKQNVNRVHTPPRLEQAIESYRKKGNESA
jgi:hypothetical protein